MTARPRAVALVDGEHYPPVTIDALRSLGARAEIVAAVMLGGGEKLNGSLVLGDLPVLQGRSQRETLEHAVDEFRPDEVIDLSDEPVLTSRARNLLMAVAAARGVAYRGAGFVLDAPTRVQPPAVPTVAIIGTGKRTGKTAVSAAFARAIAARGSKPVIVAMGRGGPDKPVVTRGDLERPTVASLLELAARGEHAASDTYEDAVVAGVTTVGARRAGSGLLGEPVFHTVFEAMKVAETEGPDLLILEGSGTAIPPVAADVTILVVGGATPAVDMGSALGFYRLLIADLALVTMAEEPVLSTETISALTSSNAELARDVPVVRTVFRPAPIGSVEAKRVFFATTAPEAAGRSLRTHLEEAHGAVVVGITHRLSDRSRLSQDLANAEGTYEVLLTELKAAAVDVAARTAMAAGAEVVFADNVPVGDGMDAAFETIVELAQTRAEARIKG
ncbi:MAG: 2,3-diphosphoglycerate synthetase [Actinomycetota bacterium]